MPRGVPKAGFRMTRRMREKEGLIDPRVTRVRMQETQLPTEEETDEEIEARIIERFDIMNELVDGALDGEVRALIVSGPPGLGKSFSIETKLAERDPNAVNFNIIKGYVRQTALYKELYKCREPGNVLLLDDCDSILRDEVSLDMLKAVCDSRETRVLTYGADYVLIDDEVGRIPRQFEFFGSVIMLSNLDFEELISRNSKLGPHLSALMSRAHYIDLAMKTPRHFLVRIKQVVRDGQMLTDIPVEHRQEVIDFIEKNLYDLREVSLRTVLKVGAIRRRNRPNWEAVARVTACTLI